MTASSSAPWDADEDEEELLEGSMLKRGTGMFVAWKERLFLLTSKQLLYFEDGRLSPTKGSMLLRDVKTFDMALAASKYGKKYCLSLARAGPSLTWVLCTDTESDFIRWRDALRRKYATWRDSALFCGMQGTCRSDVKILPLSI
jgi:hypothetical protein